MENLSNVYYSNLTLDRKKISSKSIKKIQTEEEKYYKYVGIIMGTLIVLSIVLNYIMPTTPL